MRQHHDLGLILKLTVFVFVRIAVGAVLFRRLGQRCAEDRSTGRTQPMDRFKCRIRTSFSALDHEDHVLAHRCDGTDRDIQ